MITLYFTDCQWGTDPIDNGIQINLLEPDAQIMAQIPFTGNALEVLVRAASKELTRVQMEEIMAEHGQAIQPQEDQRAED